MAAALETVDEWLCDEAGEVDGFDGTVDSGIA